MKIATLTKNHVAAVKQFSSEAFKGQDSRVVLCCGHLNEDKFIATDGRIIAVVPLEEVDIGDEMESEAGGTVPQNINIHRDDIAAAGKLLSKKKSDDDYLKRMWIRGTEESVALVAGSLQAHTCTPVAEKFPNYKQVLIDPEKVPVSTVTFGAEFLAKLAAYAKATGETEIKLRFYSEGHVKTPVGWDIGATTGVLMPMHTR